MSVVIAIKDKNKIYLGCDTQASGGNNKINLKDASSQKVWHHNNLPDLVLGGAGSLRDIQIIQTSINLFDLTSVLLNKIDYTFLVQHFFTNVYNILAEKNRIGRDTTGNLVNIIDCEFIVAFGDKMYHIDQEGTVIEANDYLVIGSGSEVAIGVLENNKNKKPQTRIQEAIKACAENTLYVNNEMYITDTTEEVDDVIL